jgi:hypothetical protein
MKVLCIMLVIFMLLCCLSNAVLAFIEPVGDIGKLPEQVIGTSKKMLCQPGMKWHIWNPCDENLNV